LYGVAIFDTPSACGGVIHSGFPRAITLNEDATHMTVGNTGIVMASINNLDLALTQQAKFYNTAQARKSFAADLSRPFSLLTTPSLLL